MDKTLYITLIIFTFCNGIAGAEDMEKQQGIKIELNQGKYEKSNEIEISGSFSTFVNCGSQYAIWSRFPDVIRYALTDLDTKSDYHSIDNQLSISWDGNDVYEQYSKEPCNKIVEKQFSINLSNVYFNNPPQKEIRQFKIHAYYFGHTSNSLIFKDTPLLITR